MATKQGETLETWHPARLIPTTGIKGQQEQEGRATSVLLAVLRAVPEFAQAILKPLGAPKGRVSTFVEVPLKDADGKVHRPDGAIVVERGKTRWSCLVEVKTGDAVLESDQVTRYVDMAKLHGFDAVVTISAAITAAVDELPYAIHGAKLRAMPTRHLSWWRIITEAIVQQRFRGVEDPDQAWILGELIAYLQHEASGAAGFRDMGPHWVAARDAAHDGTLRASDEKAGALCEAFDRLSESLALGLAQTLGVDVRVVRPRNSSREDRLSAALRRLVESGCLSCAIRIEDTAGDLQLSTDLRTRRVSVRTLVGAPEDGRPLTRIRWLARQLPEAPDSLRVEVGFRGTSETTSELLSVIRDAPERLLSPTDAARQPKHFVVELTRPMGAKRGRGKGSYVTEAERQVSEFYSLVLQRLTEWRARAPRLQVSDPDGTDGARPGPEPSAAARDAEGLDAAGVSAEASMSSSRNAWAEIDGDDTLSDLEKYERKIRALEDAAD